MKPVINESNLVVIDQFPLHYDRSDLGYGVPSEIYHKFKSQKKLRTCLAVLKEIMSNVGWMPHIENILTAGTYVPRPQRHSSKTSPHAYGNAIDFDSILLKPNPLSGENGVYTYGNPRLKYGINKEGWPLVVRGRLNARIRTRFACMLYEAGFTTVITSGYNKLHEDHIHADTNDKVQLANNEWVEYGRPPGWEGRDSQVVHLQEALNAWYNAKLVVDGKNGPKTIAAMHAVYPPKYLKSGGANNPEDYWNISFAGLNKVITVGGFVPFK